MNAKIYVGGSAEMQIMNLNMDLNTLRYEPV